MVDRHPDTTEPKKTKEKGPNQRERGYIRAMLAEELSKNGYTISKFLPKLMLKINLGTVNLFERHSTIADEYWLKLIGIDIYGLSRRNDEVAKIASVADPDCAKKVGEYVSKGHIKLLQYRLQIHTEYLKYLDTCLKSST